MFYLARQYLTYHLPRTLILVSALTLLLFLPVAIQTVIERAATSLRSRAASTPLLIGGLGSETDLVLSSLYFDSGSPVGTTYAEHSRVRNSGLAKSIPLYVRFRATAETPIVGTSLSYFDFRDLKIATGREFTILGECVLGNSVARSLKLSPSDTLLSRRENVFELAGTPPLKMHVVGVLAANGTADDEAVFVDVKTTWVMAGLGHGHTAADSLPEDKVLERDAGGVTASAAVEMFTEITPDNVDRFHFHGDFDTFPLSAVIAIPKDQKSASLLQGRYLSVDETAQIIQPAAVMDRLLGSVFRVRNFLLAGAAVLGVSLLLLVGLVLSLSHRLRSRELETLQKIGCSRSRRWQMIAWENGLLLTICLLSATLLLLLILPLAQWLIFPLLR
jgi:putative ABC transport system permease protein